MENIGHDPRLTDLLNGQYRILRDGQKILVPVGMSTTKPLMPEIVMTNHQMYGTINQSYFMPPWMDFINSEVDTRRFDRFQIGVWRPNIDTEDFPYDNPSVDYHDDLGLKKIWANGIIYWNAIDDGIQVDGWTGFATEFTYVNEHLWATPKITFNAKQPSRRYLSGEFFFICNPNSYALDMGTSYNTNLFLQEVNLPITAIVTSASYHNGNSQIELINKNSVEYPLNLGQMAIDIVGGE